MDITAILTKILKSVYGKDVRNAIHDGIEACATKCTETETKTQNLITKCAETETKMQDLITKCAETETKVQDLEAKTRTEITSLHGKCTDLETKCAETETKVQEYAEKLDPYFKQSVDFETQTGGYWGVNHDRTITKYYGSLYLPYENAVIPVSEGEVYEIHCAKSGDGYRIEAPIIAVSNATASEADGIISIFENPTDGDDQYLVTVPEGANFLLVSNVRKSHSGIDMEIYRKNDLNDMVEKVNQIRSAVMQDILNTAQMHRNIYRGKYLGSEITEEMLTNIQNGTFKNLFIGDYWTIDGINYRIADFDYWLNVGYPDDDKIKSHHAVIVPDTKIADKQMNSTNTATGGYFASAMKTEHLNTVAETLPDAVRSRLLVHKIFTDGRWMRTSVDLMNEVMVYGCHIMTGSSQTSEAGQLALFRLCPELRKTNENYWLRDVVDSNKFALVSYYGDASADMASNGYGIRPAFAIA